jgi:hypothetical protein
MDKNIKKIISEAFNELYSEMMSEAPETALRNLSISDEEIHGENGLLAKAMRSGRGFTYDQTSGDKKANKQESQENFNNLIEMLINDYESTGNEMSKKAIQNAFAPDPYRRNKIYRQITDGKFKTHEDIDDAAMAAYKSILLDRFDETLAGYRHDGTFGALIADAMKKRIHDYIVKGWSQGVGDEDAWRKSAGGTKSTEDSLGGEGGKTFGDTIASTALDMGFSGIKDKSKKRDMLKDVVNLIDDSLQDYKYNKSHYLAFKGLMAGDDTQQVYDRNPEAFGDKKYVNIYFDRFLQSPIAKDASAIVARYNNLPEEDYDWLQKISKLDLQQTFSQRKEWDPTGSHRTSERTEGIENELKAVREFLVGLGYAKSPKEIKPEISTKGTDGKFMNSNAEKIFNDLEANEKFEEAAKFEQLLTDLEYAKERDKAQGGYGSSLGDVQKDPRESLKSIMDKFGVDPSEYENFQVRGDQVIYDIINKYNIPKKVSGVDSEGKLDPKKGLGKILSNVRGYTYGGMFEGIDEKDVDKLMERVLRRLSK